jgi:hypothetical protein
LLLVGLAFATRSADLPQPTATARVITAVPAGPTLTPFNSPPTAPSFEPLPATSVPPSPPPGVVSVGSLVQVTGTGEDGVLRLRAEASLNSSVNYLALEREVFHVQGGPQEGDGFVWWYLVDFTSGARSGWAVQNYLQVVQP